MPTIHFAEFACAEPRSGRRRALRLRFRSYIFVEFVCLHVAGATQEKELHFGWSEREPAKRKKLKSASVRAAAPPVVAGGAIERGVKRYKSGEKPARLTLASRG